MCTMSEDEKSETKRLTFVKAAKKGEGGVSRLWLVCPSEFPIIFCYYSGHAQLINLKV
jgi:hypothetical protein